MRIKSLLAISAIAMACGGITAEPASAFHDHFRRGGYGDPYAYFYSPRGYYPYYNSGYWVKPRVRRYKGDLPPYYQAWGANKRYYHHGEWHYRMYGGHRRGDW
jgi:hypothetical protein